MQKIMLRGRATAKDEISALLAGAAAGRGGARLFHGDPGIGRSALLRFAASEAVDFAVVELFSGDAVSAALSSPSEPVGDPFARAVAALDAVRAVARRQPLLICVDDAHDLDRETRGVLGFLARRLDGERVAVIITCEGGEPVLAGIPHHRLEPLDRDASRQVVEDLMASRDDDLGPQLAAIAEGNPLALAELVQHVRLTGTVPATLPPTSRLRRLYRARLATLPEPTRRLLLLAAADPDLDATELTRAATESGLDVTGLEPAERAGLITAAGRIEFSQPLVRTVVYHEADAAARRAVHSSLAATLTASNMILRRNLHLAAASTGVDAGLAKALEDAAATAAHGPASIALERAAELTVEPGAAARRLVAAAERAWLGGEPHRTKLLLGRVPEDLRTGAADQLIGEIELTAGAARPAERTLLRAAARLTERDRHRALAALLRAGEAACLAGDYARYPAIAGRAGALRQPNEPPALELVFEQFAGQAALFQGRLAAAVGPLKRVFSLATSLDDARALTSASGAAILLGDDVRAGRLATRAAEVARATGDRAVLPQALEYAAVAEFALGRYPAATAMLLEGLRVARETGQERLISTNLGTLAVLAAITGDRPTCLLRVREVRSQPFVGVRPTALVEWALAAIDLFDGPTAPALRRLRSVVRPGGDLVLRVAAAPHYVEAAVRTGDRAAARRAVEEFDPWAASTGSGGWLALAARSRALAAPDLGEANEHFEAALGFHAAGFERARTELLFGERLRGAGVDARQHLRSALELFEAYDAGPWRDRAAAALRSIDASALPAASGDLTAQQLQIARMVADGATNQEVAARLFLSRRTVEYHLRNIYLRLGVRSRVELVRLVS
ncbi:LuxR C-terminal-related transcriptional regulator [Virgisporangium aurantiacum]|uniref:Helix-turn-helix transcriptional regulator n=1 Tax=Virgisporangium aurantiacum TaxID=175570 RepID=A0A8J4DYT3_9ACTN|nr:helix-turn-helix transcriptional regulator [Virgisporangium aurantiacum]GIJ53367.1 helix-turn-helix transcriptional regulator [Virgisporangium aurantiacum]